MIICANFSIMFHVIVGFSTYIIQIIYVTILFIEWMKKYDLRGFP